MDDKKPKSTGVEVGAILALLALIAVVPAIYAYFKEALLPYDPQILAVWSWIVVFAKAAVGWIIGLSLVFSLFFMIVIVYCVEQLKLIRKKEEAKYDLKVEPAFEPESQADAALARRWESVQKHISSDNENDWKQAIIEADIMLDDILTKMGYRGETIGEKLKRVDKGDFRTLDDAWEAHKVRNQIAHDGSAFSLNHHEAKHTINAYKRVFEEFFYI